jgi:hypothetical protein
MSAGPSWSARAPREPRELRPFVPPPFLSVRANARTRFSDEGLGPVRWKVTLVAQGMLEAGVSGEAKAAPVSARRWGAAARVCPGAAGCRSACCVLSRPRRVSTSADALLLVQGPTVTADAVVGRDGFLLGSEASYDVRDGKVQRYNLAAGFSAPEYAVTLHGLGNLSTYSASYYHRVNSDIETSARATYDSKAPASNVNLEVGTKT